MDLTSLLAGPLGGILGLGGALLQKWMGMKEKAADHKMRLEELEIVSRIDLQKADLLFRGTVEEKAGESFSKAIDAQRDAKPVGRIASNFIALFRPGLTLLLMISSTGLAIWYRNSAPELLNFITTSMFTMSSVAVGYWFGVRNDEKIKVQAAFQTPSFRK